MKHGIYAYRKGICRCVDCREANNKRQQRADKARASRPVPDHVHGTTNGYRNYLCRCEPCTKANTDSCRKYKKRKRQSA
jgi:hypothetical protein